MQDNNNHSHSQLSSDFLQKKLIDAHFKINDVKRDFYTTKEMKNE